MNRHGSANLPSIAKRRGSGPVHAGRHFQPFLPFCPHPQPHTQETWCSGMRGAAGVNGLAIFHHFRPFFHFLPDL